MKFSEFNLHSDVLKGIESAGYVDCTPVQEEVLRSALEGSDLYVQSQTGTGKTAAFLVSIIQELLTREEAAGKKAIIMVPTRELAVQVEEEARVLSSGTNLKCASFYGGVGYSKQMSDLKNNVDIIVGTPGRVIDLQESGTMNLSQVAFLVVDEADRMFDMGFYPDLRKLIHVLPDSKRRQTMLFSATLNAYVKNLAWEYTANAREITIDAEQITVEEIDQRLIHTGSDQKLRLLLAILHTEKPESVLVFCNTKKTCEIVSKRLRINGIGNEFIIGDLPQVKRLQIFEDFKAGKLSCLVATDVAARGIDISDLAMVVNYDIPNEAENYVHRTGRTARAGKSGKAYTFCSEQDVYDLVPVERFINGSIPVVEAPPELADTVDQSAGIYIKLDNYTGNDYDDRRGRDRRGERSDGRRSDTRRTQRSDGRRADGRGGEQGDGRRYTDRRPERRVEQGDGRRADGRGGEQGDGRRYTDRRSERRAEDAAPRRISAGDSPSHRRNSGQDESLLQLNFEERMKVYRERYETEGSGDTRAGKRRGGTTQAAGERPAVPVRSDRDSRPDFGRDSQSREGRGEARRNDHRRRGKPRGDALPQTGARPREARQAPVAKPAPSRGVFAKLKSLFGKK
ncbi:MAG: DEAD/DEAH box helicase [Spirochaetaceae bacterium]|jgi:ATP-dependent RNA helicase RhlB|nr:DEAD/DEAH box helicase [Spirochaetaceae bacterium]